jgi:hypothetical protein
MLYFGLVRHGFVTGKRDGSFPDSRFYLYWWVNILTFFLSEVFFVFFLQFSWGSGLFGFVLVRKGLVGSEV